MTDRPILFSAPMIRALLAGRKSQTRRVLKLPVNCGSLCIEYGRPYRQEDDGVYRAIKPRIVVGDRLCVRETLRFDWPTNDWRYDADRAICCDVVGTELETPTPTRWPLCVCVSIHMPRVLSRLTLTVTDVRVQRLMEITEADAEAEGADPILVPPDGGSAPHVEGFRQLWNSIHGPDADFANPWVAAYTFTVEQKNIDA